MSDTAKIFLVDDHTVVRSGLKSLIERLGNYDVIAEFDNGQELLDELPFTTEPDLIVMDLEMPVLNGSDTVKALKEKGLMYKVLVLTLETDEATIISLFKNGIRGYLAKSSTADVLKKAISDVLTSGYYHDEMFAKAMTYDGNNETAVNITDREKEFLRLVCREDEPTYEQISDTMGVSRRTVDGYRESLFSKFNIKSKTGLVMFAIKYRIVTVS